MCDSWRLGDALVDFFTKVAKIDPNMTKVKFRIRKPWAIPVFASLLIFVGAIWGIALRLTPGANHAAEVALPIENALVKAGAKGGTSVGDNGYSIDGSQPYYDSAYDVAMDRSEALGLISRIAEDNGYSLSQVTPSNKGFLVGLDDAHVNEWFIDVVRKPSPYPDLEKGEILLAFQLVNNSREVGHSLIRVLVKLPLAERH